jgi:hypothetical protein
MKVKSYNLGLEKEFRIPKNLSLEGKFTYLKNKYHEVLLKNSFSQAQKETLEKYMESLEQAVDYILGVGDYRKLTNEARRIVMFFLSIRKAWSLTPKLIHKEPEEIFKFLNIDLLPDIRKQIILDFMSEKGRQKRKLFQDWEIKILSNEELNNIQAMYMIGRTYESIYSFRRKRRLNLLLH